MPSVTRPCWWWMPLLPTGTESISVPDTVVLTSTLPHHKVNTVSGQGTNQAASSTQRTPVSPNRLSYTASRSNRRALLWTFSRSEPGTNDKDGIVSKPRGGITTEEELATPTAPPAGRRRREEDNASNQPSPLVPLVQRLHAESVDGEEGLLRAVRAICECGKRQGGGMQGGVRGEEGSKLPLALLKIWARDNDKGRQRHCAPAGNEKHERRGRRRLRVVS